MAKNRGNRPPRRDRHGVPEIPPEVETLRDARKVIDPAWTYRLQMPDGSTFSATGAELLETAAAAVAVADADRAGDDEALRQALARLGLGPIPPREAIAPMARARKRNRDVVTITMAGSEETTRRVTEMFPQMEREAARIAEHGGQCVMCGAFTRTCNGEGQREPTAPARAEAPRHPDVVGRPTRGPHRGQGRGAGVPVA